MDLSEISANPYRHPWEMSRADFLMAVIKKHVVLNAHSELLDVGAGDLFFSERIHGATSVKIDAVDSAFDEEGTRNQAIQKIKHLSTVLHKRYDAICALDVLEHVSNDQEFFDLILGMMKPGATFIMTVPAFNSLFSSHDRSLRHFRRYNLSRLKELTRDENEYPIKEAFYFFNTLLYIRIVQKITQLIFGEKKELESFQSINEWKFSVDHPFTRLIEFILKTDALICRTAARLGIRIPGLSLCLVLERRVPPHSAKHL